MRRLLWVFVLFLAVFLGKQVQPDRLLAAGERVIYAVSQNTELEQLLVRLGQSVSSTEGVLEGLEQFCVEVFGPQSETQPELGAVTVFKPDFPQIRSGLLAGELENMNRSDSTSYREVSVPTVGTVLLHGTGQELPEGYTADMLSFGALETVTPVLGHLNSAFGYRDHPVNGIYSIHAGADISADAGDPIVAFADGVVEYVGEDSTYGLYLQLDHGNEIKSFYAHCGSVCVEKGQRVTAGERVAAVGATGRVTGPHLHLELKCCGVRVDPAHYVDFL